MRAKILVFGFCAYAFLSMTAMAGMSIGAIILAVSLMIYFGPLNLLGEIRRELTREDSKNYLYFALFLTVACALSLLVARWNPVSYGGQISEIHFFADMAKAWYLFWPLIIVPGLRKLSEDQRDKILRVWIWTLLGISIVGVIQYFTGWPRPQAIPGSVGRFHATEFFGHHLSPASILLFPFFAALDFFRGRFVFKHRGILALAIAFGFLALFLTYSRTLWIALPLGILLWIFLTQSKKVFISTIVAGAIGIAIAFQIPQISARLHYGDGITQRQDLWKANFHFFLDRPWTGVGWRHTLENSGYYLMDLFKSNDVFSGHAHNNFLEMLGGTGAIGTVAWSAYCVFIFVLLFRERKKGTMKFATGLICAWFVFHLNGMTQVNFWDGKVLHQMMWSIAWILLA